MLRKILAGIRNLIYWFPIIWRDRPWDYVYLLKIIKHKIEQMEASTPDWFRVDSEEVAGEMRDMIQVIDDLISERAERDAFIAHERIFGPAKRTFREQPGSDQLPGGPFVEMITTYPEAEDDEAAKRALISFLEIAQLTHRIVLETFARGWMRIEKWWD